MDAKLKKLLSVLIIGGLVLVAVATSRQQSIDSSSKTGELQLNPTTEDGFNRFLQNMAGHREYRATITTLAGGIEGVILMETDGENYRTLVQTAEGNIESIITPGAYYIKQPGTEVWIKTSQNSLSDLEQYKFETDEAQEAYRNAQVTKVGEERCGELTCEVYSYTQNGSDMKVYVDNREYLLRRFDYVAEGQTTTVEYEYTEIEIVIPETVQELNIPALPQIPLN